MYADRNFVTRMEVPHSPGTDLLRAISTPKQAEKGGDSRGASENNH